MHSNNSQNGIRSNNALFRKKKINLLTLGFLAASSCANAADSTPPNPPPSGNSLQITASQGAGQSTNPAAAGTTEANAPIIENDRVRVWDVTCTIANPNPIPKAACPELVVLVKDSDQGSPNKESIRYVSDGRTKLKLGERAIVIQLQNHPVAPLPDAEFPPAFPRPYAKKLFENNRIVVWNYAWHLNEPTPIHVQDKDCITVFMAPGSISSKDATGKIATGQYAQFQTIFNSRGRIEFESLVDGNPSAIFVELKDTAPLGSP